MLFRGDVDGVSCSSIAVDMIAVPPERVSDLAVL